MEVCRKCKKPFKETDEYINVLASWTLGFIGRGKYHLDCWDKSKKTGIIVTICLTIFFLAIMIAAVTIPIVLI